MLVHKYMMKAISNIVAAVSSFVALMVMTRYVSYEYGVMMWGFAFVALFNVVVDLGFETAHIKFVAEGKDQNDCFSTFAVIKSSLTVLMIVLASGSVFLGITDTGFDDSTTKVVLIFIVYYAIANIKSIFTITFDARLESGKSSIVLAIESVGRSILLIVLAFMQVSADLLSMAYLVGMIFTALAALALCKNINLRFVRPTMIKEYAIFAAPLVISSLVLMAMEALDRVMIGLNGNPYEVSYYAAAIGAVIAGVSLGKSINNVILPQLSSPEMVCSKIKTEGLIWTSQKYLLMFLLPVTAVLMVHGEPIAVVLFGAEYYRAGTILSILSVMMTLKILSGVLSQVLYASNKTGLYTKASVIYGVLVIVLYLLFIPSSSPFPWTGGIGAALAVTLGSMVYIVLLTYYVKNSTGVGIYRQLWKHILAMTVTLIAMLAIPYYFEVSGLLRVAVISVLGLVIHLVVLAALGEFTKDDVRFFRNAINPKQIYESLEDELQ